MIEISKHTQQITTKAKKTSQKLLTAIGVTSLLVSSILNTGVASVFAATTSPASINSLPTRQMENLDRGVVAVKVNNGVFVSWRVLLQQLCQILLQHLYTVTSMEIVL